MSQQNYQIDNEEQRKSCLHKFGKLNSVLCHARRTTPRVLVILVYAKNINTLNKH